MELLEQEVKHGVLRTYSHSVYVRQFIDYVSRVINFEIHLKL